jgi:flagellar hook-associated protein 3 FlgL
MRISDQLLQQNVLRAVRATLDRLSRAQLEVTTGRRLNTLSDAPVDAARVMQLDSSLRDIDQFRRNATEATTRLSTEDAVLTTTGDLLHRAQQLALTGATQSSDGPLRQAALQEVQQIYDQIVSLGNTKVGGEYIFAGGQTDAPPFLTDGRYVGDATVHQAQIDSGFVIDVNHTGDRMLGSTLQALQNVLQQLQTGSKAELESAASTLGDAAEQVQETQAEVGARMSQIQTTVDQLGRRASLALDQRDQLSAADPTESVLKVTTMQSAMERAYAVIARVMQTHLTDFLR